METKTNEVEETKVVETVETATVETPKEEVVEEETKVEEKPKKKAVLLPMSQVVDKLLLKGGKIDDIVKKAKAEADKRKVKTLSTKGQIVAHSKYRISKKTLKIALKDDMVTVTK